MAPAREPVYAKDEKVLCFHLELLYEAKVLDTRQTEVLNPPYTKYATEYKIHYKGWKATWDDWVPHMRLLKLNEENKQLARDYKERMDHMRGFGISQKPAKKRALDSDFSSTRGSEDRQTPVAATGRGTKRGRDNEIEKVSERSPWLKASTLQKAVGLAGEPYSRKPSSRKRLRSPSRTIDVRRRLLRTPLATGQRSENVLHKRRLERTPSIDAKLRLNMRPIWTERGSDQHEMSYVRRHESSPLSSVQSSPEHRTVDSAFWDLQAGLLSNAERQSFVHPARTENVSQNKTESVSNGIPVEADVDEVVDELLSAADLPQDGSTTPEEDPGSPPPVITQTLLPNPAAFTRRSGRNFQSVNVRDKDRISQAMKRTKLQAMEDRYAWKKESLNGAGAHAPFPAIEPKKKHPKLSSVIHNPSRVHFYSGVPHDMNIVLAGTSLENEPREIMQFDTKLRTRKTRMECTDKQEQEEMFHSRPAVKINVPDHIKSILVDDWENVTKNLSLTPVPNPHPVFEIIDTYFDEKKGQRRLGSPEADILEEVVQGMKDYFNDCLGKILLYRFEREQYFEVRQSIDKGLEGFKDKSVGDMYGAEHLCRLIVSLPELIAQTNMDQQSINKLRAEVSELTVWLGKNSSRFFTAEYESASQEYIEKARGV